MELILDANKQIQLVYRNGSYGTFRVTTKDIWNVMLGRAYRNGSPCPSCGRFMTYQNYGYTIDPQVMEELTRQDGRKKFKKPSIIGKMITCSACRLWVARIILNEVKYYFINRGDGDRGLITASQI